ncbi:receptor [Nesidiocoris tenuis]|uniref:Receptor n=1 Tax=Nesidiocoris tenuis TaxID=355587 RepID=A0ABN7AKJ0_9HEMI|nr:receptor [Nesidiocoris tenuis]
MLCGVFQTWLNIISFAFDPIHGGREELLSSSLEPLWGPKRDPLYIVVPVTVLYSLIFLTGVVGNVCTCVVIARNRHMQTTTNYYLFSLAISDVLLLISGLPTEMYTVWSKYPYVFGETFCVISGLASETSSNATVLTITAFTVERYVAICHPFHTHVVSKLSRAIKFVIAIWLIALACAVPQAAQLGLVYAKDDISGEKVSEEYKICGLKSPYPYAFETFTVLFFFAPMTVITILYMLIGIKLHSTTKVKSGQRLRDSRKSAGYGTTRVVKMLVVVVVAFFICWAPFQAQRLFAVYGANTSPRMILMYKAITYMSGLLYYLSTTINPFLYNIMSLKFREAFKSTLTRCLSRNLRSEAPCGSSGGGLAPRFNYSVLSHRSARNSNNSNNNNNNSYSSDNSFIDQIDLHRRPLVVSFKRKSASVSLDYVSSKPDLLQVPTRRSYYTPVVVMMRENSPRPPATCSPTAKKSLNETMKFPRIEEIEIFRESRMKIERKHGRRRDDKVESCSVKDNRTMSESTLRISVMFSNAMFDSFM